MVLMWRRLGVTDGAAGGQARSGLISASGDARTVALPSAAMKFVGWNCRGKGRSLRNSNKMEYLAKMMNSTAAQDCALYMQQLSPQMQPEQVQDKRQHRPQQGCNATQETGHILFSDAAWSPPPAPVPQQAGLGVFVQLQGHHAASIYISARSPPVSSPIEAEAFGLLLAVKVADCLHLHDPLFRTDSSVLVQATTRENVSSAGPWMIRHIISAVRNSASFDISRIAHIFLGTTI